jgi:hypothetical protein
MSASASSARLVRAALLLALLAPAACFTVNSRPTGFMSQSPPTSETGHVHRVVGTTFEAGPEPTLPALSSTRF